MYLGGWKGEEESHLGTTMSSAISGMLLARPYIFALVRTSEIPVIMNCKCEPYSYRALRWLLSPAGLLQAQQQAVSRGGKDQTALASRDQES